MKIWITCGIAFLWIAFFTVWIVLQDSAQAQQDAPPQGRTDPDGLAPRRDTERPRGRAGWAPRGGPWRGPADFDQGRSGVFALGGVLLATLDKNGDGTLSHTEIEEAREALRSLDLNGDGDVTREEFFHAMPNLMSRLNGETTGGGSYFPRGPRPGSPWDRKGRRGVAGSTATEEEQEID